MKALSLLCEREFHKFNANTLTLLLAMQETILTDAAEYIEYISYVCYQLGFCEVLRKDVLYTIKYILYYMPLEIHKVLLQIFLQGRFVSMDVSFIQWKRDILEIQSHIDKFHQKV